jgi:hypothetical protein
MDKSALVEDAQEVGAECRHACDLIATRASFGGSYHVNRRV